MFKRRDYQSELNLHDTWHKFASSENEEQILSFLEQTQWLPSSVTIDRAVQHLQLQRTDGRTEKDDARATRAEAQRAYDSAARKADEPPPTRLELDEFASLSQAELARKYWGQDLKASDFFSIRYRKASRDFGYRIPAKPVVEVDERGAIRLTAAEYKSMPAAEVLRRMRNPRFKEAVYKLIAAKEI